RRLPVHATAAPRCAGPKRARRRHALVTGPYGKSAPPAVSTSISCPSQTALAAVPPGSGASRRHAFVWGSYAAARASRAGHGFPSGFRLLTRSTSSRPVQAPTGCWLPARGDAERFRQRFVTGLYATPEEKASPQQPPPQPISSRPVQTSRPPADSIPGLRGRSRQRFVAGLYAW